MPRRNTPQRIILAPFALTYCFLLVIVFCLTFILYEYFHLESYGWMPTRLPVAINAERSLMELYPSVFVALENHHPNYPGTSYYIMGNHLTNEPSTMRISLSSLAEILPDRLKRTRGRIYIAARRDVPYSDVAILLRICRASGAKSIKLLVSSREEGK